MKLDGTHQLHASRARVYALLTNPEVLQRCIPGCERLDETAPNTYSTTMKAGVGSIKGIFNGTVRLEDLRSPEHFRMIVEGKGTPGFVKGTGDLDGGSGRQRLSGTVVTFSLEGPSLVRANNDSSVS